jgi:hypothetical protein
LLRIESHRIASNRIEPHAFQRWVATDDREVQGIRARLNEVWNGTIRFNPHVICTSGGKFGNSSCLCAASRKDTAFLPRAAASVRVRRDEAGDEAGDEAEQA